MSAFVLFVYVIGGVFVHEVAAKTIARAAPDFVEVLPVIIFPEVVLALKRLLPDPFIAGGFIRNAADVARIHAAGVVLSSSTYELWYDSSR